MRLIFTLRNNQDSNTLTKVVIVTTMCPCFGSIGTVSINAVFFNPWSSETTALQDNTALMFLVCTRRIISENLIYFWTKLNESSLNVSDWCDIDINCRGPWTGPCESELNWFRNLSPITQPWSLTTRIMHICIFFPSRLKKQLCLFLHVWPCTALLLTLVPRLLCVLTHHNSYRTLTCYVIHKLLFCCSMLSK